MKAHELEAGTKFRVVGLPDWWEALDGLSGSVRVRPLDWESRTFATINGDEITISFRPKAFYISRETTVEVKS